MLFSQRYKQNPLCRVHYYDNRANRLLSHEDYFPQFQLLDGNKLKNYKTVDPAMNGFLILSPQTFHFCPAILTLEAQNIALENVTIHSHPGMGIVGYRSENIKMTGLRIVPLVGQYMSSNTDATHFTSWPADVENYYLINSTRLPSVEITGCSVMANRARGFLIKTRNVKIEHTLIRESTGTGIRVGSEGSWHEGPTSENVTIRYNRILRCGTGAGTIDQACGIAVSVGAEKADLHKHIQIEGNIIEGENAENGIAVSGAEDINDPVQRNCRV